VRGEEQGRSGRAHPAQDVAHAGDARGIEAEGRLVEKEEFRLVQHHARQAGALLHAARIGAEGTVGGRRQAHSIEYCRDALARLGHAMQPGEEFEIGAGRHFRIDARLLLQIADAQPHAAIARTAADAEQFDFPAVGADEAHHHVHDGRLARAIGPEEAHDLAALDP
jgi:hypothetical protein